MTEGIHITRARLHELLTDAHVALVEHRETQAGAIINALRKITAPEHPAAAPLPLLMQIRPQHHLPAEPGSRGTPADAPTAEGAPVAPAPSPAQAAGGIIHPHLNAGRAGGVWTDERIALLRQRFPTSADDDALLADLRALSGLEIASRIALCQRAYKLGLKRDATAVRALRARGGAVAQARRQTRSGGPPSKWTPERDALLRAEFPACTDRAALLERINAMPGVPIASVDAMRAAAVAKGVRATPEVEHALRSMNGRKGGMMNRTAPAAEAPVPVQPLPVALLPEPAEPSPEEQARIADAAVESRQERVKQSLREMLARKPRDEFVSAAQIGTRHGMPVREVLRLLGEVRRERKAA